MRTVDIRDLKTRLSAHLQLVREGEELLIIDRNTPVARILPVRLDDRPEQERRLVARGILTLPLKSRPAFRTWPQPPGNVPEEVIEQLWREERGDR